MKDSYGRTIDYLRISITDACNLRCRYCMPEGQEFTAENAVGSAVEKQVGNEVGKTADNEAEKPAGHLADRKCAEKKEQAPLLTQQEILRVVKACAALGVTHYRVTGGEPLVRKDCVELIRKIKKVPGVQSVGITTNGVLLGACAVDLKKAGCDSVNVSLDTVDRAAYEKITGRDVLETVKEGIRIAKKEGLFVKLNTVHQEGLDARAILEFADQEQVPVRFIEMMPVGAGKAYVGPSNEVLKETITAWYGACMSDAQKEGNGPAVYETYEKLSIPVGFISALHGKFCKSCNRVRLTSHGFLKLCLCYGDGVSLRDVLKTGDDAALEECVKQAVLKKPLEHCFWRPEEMTEHHLMSGIGG